METLLSKRESNEIVLDSERAPTAREGAQAVKWYAGQRHHTADYPERNRRVTVFAVEFKGMLKAQAFIGERRAA